MLACVLSALSLTPSPLTPSSLPRPPPTPLERLTRASKIGNAYSMSRLLTENTFTTDQLNNALCLSAAQGSVACMELLINRGAHDTDTAAIFATKSDRYPALRLLTKVGLSAAATKDAITVAASHGYADCEFLLHVHLHRPPPPVVD